jgi:hypothetical protein
MGSERISATAFSPGDADHIVVPDVLIARERPRQLDAFDVGQGPRAQMSRPN